MGLKAGSGKFEEGEEKAKKEVFPKDGNVT